MIGAFSDDLLDESSFLLPTLRDIKLKSDIITIRPKELTIDEITTLVSNCFSATHVKSELLAQIIHKKTGGNPSLITTLLETLYENEDLYFDRVKTVWKWDLGAVKSVGISKNAIEEIEQTIEKLDLDQIQLLHFASCLGQNFQLKLLSDIISKPLKECLEIITSISKRGLLVPDKLKSKDKLLSTNYKFQSQRIYDAVYSLVPEDELKNIHIKIGYYLLEKEQRNLHDSLEKILYQLNKGRDFITEEKELEQLSELNITYAEDLINKVNFKEAAKYLEVADKALSKESSNYHTLLYRQYMLRARCAYEEGDFRKFELLEKNLTKLAETEYEQAEINLLKITQLVTLGDVNQAINLGLKTLKSLNFTVPEKPSQVSITKEITSLKLKLMKYSYDDLINLKACTDNNQIQIYKFITKIVDLIFQSGNKNLFLLLVYKLLNSVFKHGITPNASYVFLCYSQILLHDNYSTEDAKRYATCALYYADKYKESDISSKIYLHYSLYYESWCSPWKKIPQLLQKSIESNQLSGELFYSSLACTYYALLNPAANITRSVDFLQKYSGEINRSHSKVSEYIHIILRHFCMALQGRTTEPIRFDTEHFAELELLTKLNTIEDKTAFFVFNLYKIILLYHHGLHKNTDQYIKQCEAHISYVKNTPFEPEFRFYRFLIYSTESNAKEQKWYDTELDYFKKCATFGSTYFEQLIHILRAQISKIGNEDAATISNFKNAISSSKTNGYMRFLALSNELMGRYYRKDGNNEISSFYLKDAHSCYNRWGATTISKQLGKEFSVLVKDEFKPTSYTSTTTTQKDTGALDINSVMKASQTISSEIKLDSLLQKMMEVVIENAGAERGIFIMNRDNKLFMEAEGNANQATSLLEPIEISGTNDFHNIAISVILYVSRSFESVVLDDAVNDKKFSKDKYIVASKVKSVLCMPLIKQSKLVGILYLENNLISNAFTYNRIEILKMLSSEIAISIENARLYENLSRSLEKQKALTNAYSRFVPNQFLNMLNKDSVIDIELGDQIEKEMTVFFSDIRDFTSLSEKMSPQDNINFINSYLRRMEPIIGKYNGFIDKYIGDAIMGLFPTNPDDALKSSIAMLRRLKSLNEDRISYGWKPIHIGIGLNTGKLMLGTIGGEERIEGTVISDSVNLASRTESLTKAYGVEILITEFSEALLKDDYHIRVIDRIQVKGKEQFVTIYEVFDADTEEIIKKKKAAMPLYNEAYDAFHSQNFIQADKLFKELKKALPADKTIQIYLERCMDIISN